MTDEHELAREWGNLVNCDLPTLPLLHRIIDQGNLMLRELNRLKAENERLRRRIAVTAAAIRERCTEFQDNVDMLAEMAEVMNAALDDSTRLPTAENVRGILKKTEPEGSASASSQGGNVLDQEGAEGAEGSSTAGKTP